MKKIAVLGSTGSIGVQTLDVVRCHPELFQIVGLAAGRNLELLEAQTREFRPAIVSCWSEQDSFELKRRVSDMKVSPRFVSGLDGAQVVATWGDCDLVVSGLPGSIGLRPSFAAVEAGKDVALATKEVLVMAGELFMNSVASRGIRLLPVDSEQSAIFQCLQGNKDEKVRRIILTASGGPFRDLPPDQMNTITVEMALRHPRWKMGPKVTIDSATLMNKGLEVIEARWLFNVKPSEIEIVLHPESIVHSMVEFQDGALIAQLGDADMRIPISYALAYPNRISSGADHLHFPSVKQLTFIEPDTQKFPLLTAAYHVLQDPHPSSAVILNAADEVAVDLFLNHQIPFDAISSIVLDALDSTASAPARTIEDIEALHDQVVKKVREKWQSPKVYH
jgi:1-deoxy-D-xylulose-5-phosphate reductoisomerase|uniref:1-deoxy-D-xylulose 5-phosphate reductoisomerase n=1 Tax=Desulfomonile tiedjei TaxID=2358 RepID=A0A7C4ARK8_9BACT